VTTTQLVGLAVVGVAAAVIYLPPLLIHFRRPPDSMSQIQAVLRIRDATHNPEVRKACGSLLEALLK
jgi:hypothetical protein